MTLKRSKESVGYSKLVDGLESNCKTLKRSKVPNSIVTTNPNESALVGRSGSDIVLGQVGVSKSIVELESVGDIQLVGESETLKRSKVPKSNRATNPVGVTVLDGVSSESMCMSLKRPKVSKSNEATIGVSQPVGVSELVEKPESSCTTMIHNMSDSIGTSKARFELNTNVEHTESIEVTGLIGEQNLIDGSELAKALGQPIETLKRPRVSNPIRILKPIEVSESIRESESIGVVRTSSRMSPFFVRTNRSVRIY
ncbi:hypothetical protein LSTR_LSTR005007 [Laodelphax striatellus]|uniref:Uncharacterized protein n=1 Tax=Laodelphax striatellus TaxID=195883 RepID=A0A482XIW1_LAOST|nr:hypothetical protein LSTR_LSTR005007 [Laodelphax striatellus]